MFEDFSDGQWRDTEEYLFQCQLKPTFTKVARQNGAFKEDLETAFLLGGAVCISWSKFSYNIPSIPLLSGFFAL